MLHTNYRMGMRAFKTVLAIFICLGVAQLLGRRDSGFYACIASIICMQKDNRQTLRQGFSRMVGTLIGAAAGCGALVLVFALPSSLGQLAVIPLLAAVVIYICNLLGREDSTAIGCIVLLSVALNHGDTLGQAIHFGFLRATDTLWGILVAICVNRWVAPPKEK